MTDTRALSKEGAAAASLLATIREQLTEDQLDDETKRDMIEGETNLDQVLEQATGRVIRLRAMTKMLKEREKDLKTRRERFELSEEKLLAAIHVALGQAERKRQEFDFATVSVRTTPPATHILDENLIPTAYYVEQDPKLDRARLLADLKEGKKIPGCELTQKETVQIKER